MDLNDMDMNVDTAVTSAKAKTGHEKNAIRKGAKASFTTKVSKGLRINVSHEELTKNLQPLGRLGTEMKGEAVAGGVKKVRVLKDITNRVTTGLLKSGKDGLGLICRLNVARKG